MAKKYIQNMTKSILVIQDDKLNTVVKLSPYTCSSRSFSEEYLQELSHIEQLLNLGYITLQDTRTSIEFKSKAKDYGQKYKIGTKCYLNDESNLDLVVESFDPRTELYSVKIVRTGGVLKVKEKSLSLTKYVGKKVSISDDEFTEGEVIKTAVDNSLPQEYKKASIVYTEDNGMQPSISASDIIKSQDKISEDIANQKVDIVYKENTEEDEDTDQDEEIFLVKSDDSTFAKELTASKMVKNVSEAINEKLVSAFKKEPVEEELKKYEPDTDYFVSLSSDMQQYITQFMQKDARNKKMIIARLKDQDKLLAISKCADELSRKAASARLEKLND